MKRIAILGTGLMGGSFALAVRRALPEARIVGWDKPDVLPTAVQRGAIHESTTDLPAALRNADLVYMALPIGATLDLLPQVARRAAADALVTDVCSTKQVICDAAEKAFAGHRARFLGGHPMAGRETRGIESAVEDLFRGAKYALIAEAADPDPRVAAFAALLERIGAEPVWMDAQSHDAAAALVSHLPQLVSVALAAVLERAQKSRTSGLPLNLAGPGLRDLLRLAGSPYAMWRDVCLTNRENIRAALDQLIQVADHLRLHLADKELQAEFTAANEVYKKLKQMK